MKLIAIVGGLGSSTAFCLAEEARRIHGTRIRECVLADATIDAATLITMRDHYKAEELVLVLASTSCSEDFYFQVEPRLVEAPPRDPDMIVRTLWPNLTGSLDPNSYIEALRLLYNREFKVYMIRPRNDCKEGIQLVIGREC